MSSYQVPETTDIVFVDTLNLPINIGADCWGRSRPQIVLISVYIHLKSSFLTAAGSSDNVTDSVHYGHLTKSITALVEERPNSFSNERELGSAVASAAFELAGESAAAVRVVIESPKQILLAEGIVVDTLVPRSFHPNLASGSFPPGKIMIKDLVLAVIIGVNPPEREAKQRVITNITFYESGGGGAVGARVDYPQVVKKLAQEIEQTSYLTLEKFVMEIVRSACLSSESILAVTVRAQKPSALSFAHSSGVEITRSRSAFT
ncbi:Dihydroneopterin aldolase-domain-containing protein [Hygrophoropsis aurantiaca]|uniref:Dihydroneopterin aldolase-domain-containing protein n=1 Tax=Hygrophoropsis aurantiaca TaxID=72124 RepID=A0ACB7ZZ83_9AGAM|nr:Dihydroneopterin aldolase-domain-containing protein [Hygrophoropsis aurantiaca]